MTCPEVMAYGLFTKEITVEIKRVKDSKSNWSYWCSDGDGE